MNRRTIALYAIWPSDLFVLLSNDDGHSPEDLADDLLSVDSAD